MRCLLVIALCVLVAVLAAPPHEKGLIINLTLYGTYYRCTCESGLKCKGDISIGGSITNTNFGICVDPNSKEASAN
ncbi:colipase-like isoform X2 [Megalops cyprinoides]|uniref:colipase-like isoform X2 n=1 Tax=Megalops cyprinoides TaxID=118141 RepID=UPI0018642D06|nr:colipase-like isoform X2 [Megalops cyprinoides]